MPAVNLPLSLEKQEIPNRKCPDMTKKKLISREPDASLDSPNAVFMTHYEITDEPIQDRYYRRLPEHVKDAIERLHDESQTKPRKAIPKLKKMMEQYPKLPQLYNYLTVAYSKVGEIGKAQAVNRACIRKNPDYLFARLNYAEFCLMKKDYARIPEIFDHKFDLQLLYPERKRFHILEVVNFMGLMGVYCYEIHEREAADAYNKILHQIAPDHPMTKRLQRKLSPSFIDRLWKRLRGS